MWIRKSPEKTMSNNHSKLLWATLVDVLLGAGIWYVLMQLSISFGLLPEGSISNWIGCAVIAAILPAAWFADQVNHRKGHRTVICDRCHVVKAADRQWACGCGGHYRSLAEMKWISPEQ
jgi:hypothetical protein